MRPVLRSLGALTLLVPLVALLACKDKTCRATLDYNGITGPGAGKNRAAAQQGACWKYCGDHDRSVNAAWGSWKAKGGKTRGSKFSDLESVPRLKAALKRCEAACAKDIATGNAKVKFDSDCK